MVYVDNARIPYRRMLMSHMIADSVEELTRMAATIGISKRHLKGGSIPHFDVCEAKRRLAVSNGAVEIDVRTMAQKIEEWRARC